jgi:hypothetical protein
MEIRTTTWIIIHESTNREWVCVDDIIKYIDKQSYNEGLIKLRYELSKDKRC